MNMATRQYGACLGLLMVAAWALSSGCLAQPSLSSATAEAHAVAGRVPEEHAIEALVGDVRLGTVTPHANDADESLSDRILDGFQAASSGLTIEDGASIVWGFKFRQGNQQSVVVYDASGHVLLAAIVDNIVRIDESVETAAAYRKRVHDAGVDPDVMVFAASPEALESAFPLFKRWLQADLLGFNADCGKTPLACRLAEALSMPVRTFVARSVGYALVEVAEPSVAANTTPLKRFVQ